MKKEQQSRSIDFQPRASAPKGIPFSKSDSVTPAFKYTPYNPIQQLPDPKPRNVGLKSPAPIKSSLLNSKKINRSNLSRNPRVLASRTADDAPVKSMVDLKAPSRKAKPIRVVKIPSQHQREPG